MSDLIFLDIETTGLDPTRHEVWEIAYAVNDGPIESHVVAHEIITADPKAMELNGHSARCGCERRRHAAFDYTFEVQAKIALTGATIVGANPAFDTKFLAHRWRAEPWHYRMIDIESYAMPYLKLGRPVGLAGIADALHARKPDHSAAGDVTTLRECWTVLRDKYKALLRELQVNYHGKRLA